MRVPMRVLSRLVPVGPEAIRWWLNHKQEKTKAKENMNNKFDELTKTMAQSVTRRAALKKFGVGLAGIALASLACFGPANKAKANPGGCKGPGTICKQNSECCSGASVLNLGKGSKRFLC